MKRFWLFAGDDNMTAGGMRDFKGAFDTAAEARQHPTGTDWAHIFDAQDSVMLAWRGSDSGGSWFIAPTRLELWTG